MQLALHPEYQERVRQEVLSVLGKDGMPTWKDLPQLRLTESVGKEVLRGTPVLPLLARTSTRDMTIAGHEISRGTTVLVNLEALHVDRGLWGDDADEFRPDRWLDKDRIPENAFFPFGSGMHACVGQRLAVMELTIVVALLVRAFSFQLVPGQTLLRRTTLTTGIKSGFQVEFRRFHSSS
jgi:cytochrome P450